MSDKLTADDILSKTRPEQLFGDSIDAATKKRRELLAMWHPDRVDHDKAADVCSHINKLYDQAVVMFDKGEWQSVSFIDRSGTEHTYPYQRKYDVEIGSLFFGENIVYRVDSDFQDLFRSAERSISRLSFTDAVMRKQFEPQVPACASFHAAEYMVMPNINKDILLHDLVQHHAIPAEHSAWIISRLLNVRCYLQHIGITHNCIDLKTVSINPKKHWIWLFGGWWYSRPVSERLLALPSHLIPHIPQRVIDDKKANVITDGELIRHLARQIIGPDAPKPMRSWANFPASDDAVKDMEHWRESVLPDSFGEIKFTEYNISFTDVYME